MMALVINYKGKSFEATDVPIKPQELKVDKDGKSMIYLDPSTKKVVKKIQLSKSEYKWVFPDGTEFVGKACKSFKGKPVAEYTKTTMLKNGEVVNIPEMLRSCVQNEHTYYLVGKDLKAALKGMGEDEGLQFKPFKLRGLKAYRAVIYYDTLLDRSIMRLCRSTLCADEMIESETVKEAVATGGEAISDDDVVC